MDTLPQFSRGQGVVVIFIGRSEPKSLHQCSERIVHVVAWEAAGFNNTLPGCKDWERGRALELLGRRRKIGLLESDEKMKDNSLHENALR